VAGIEQRFDYLVPEELDSSVVIGSIVRIPLRARRVRGFVVAECSPLGGEGQDAPGARELRPISAVLSVGPSPEVVALAEYGAWRWSGPARPLLIAASPPRRIPRLAEWAGTPRGASETVARRGAGDPGAEARLFDDVPAGTAARVGGFPPPSPEGGQGRRSGLEEEVWQLARAGLAGPGSRILRLPPAAPRLVVIEAGLDLLARDGGSVLVLAPSLEECTKLATLLRRRGYPLALLPRDWAIAATGALASVPEPASVIGEERALADPARGGDPRVLSPPEPGARSASRQSLGVAVDPLAEPRRSAIRGLVIVGARSACLGPAYDLRGVIVLDAHAESYVEERSPTYSGVDLLIERARRAGVPALLVSACPTVQQLAASALVTLSRIHERRGWALLETVDQQKEDPRAGLYSPELVVCVRNGLKRDPTRPVLLLLNRKGREQLVRCRSCGAVVSCARCGASMSIGDGDGLACRGCHDVAPRHCRACGSIALSRLRPGVTRVREELEALLHQPVTEITAATAPEAVAGLGEGFPGAVLVGTEALLHRVPAASVVAFLDFDQELLAPRFRAAEQALGLLALASRLVGGRRREGRVLVQTRLPDHEVLAAARRGDPGIVADAEMPRRRLLRLPPETALAVISGQGAASFAARLRPPPLGPDTEGRYLFRSPNHHLLCEALRLAGPREPHTRVQVDPIRI
jgi:primosomal protein N' (replication factor Y)